MKSRLKIGTLLLVWSALCMSAWANAPLKSYKDIPSPEGNARRITEAMHSQLALTEKQYKKVYKIHLAEQKKIFKYRPVPQRGMGKDLEEGPRGHRMERGRPPMGGGFGGMGGGRPPMLPPREMFADDERPDPEKGGQRVGKSGSETRQEIKESAQQRAVRPMENHGRGTAEAVS